MPWCSFPSFFFVGLPFQLQGDDAEEARATELCDENKARAAFGDISYSGF
jgi:hypothetical protein